MPSGPPSLRGTTTSPSGADARGARGWAPDGACIAALVALQLVVTAVIAPRGDFGLEDDWTYAHSVLWLLGEHRVRLSDWATTGLLPQTLLGGAVAAAFGFSFEVLRHLTQAVALCTSVAAFWWFRAVRMQPIDALVAAMAVVAMPTWPLLANSFMSDLYGLLFALAAATLFVRALDRPTSRILAAAALLSALGALQNVLGISGNIGLFLVGWAAWWGMPGAAKRWRIAVVGVAIATAIVMLAVNWLPPFRADFILDRAGIGPFLLYDGQPRGLAPFDRSPGIVWRVAGVASAFGIAAWLALALATLVYVLRAGRGASRERVFMSVVIVAYLLPFVITDYFDRYLVFVLPFVFALWSVTWPARSDGRSAGVRRGVALLWLAACIMLAAMATHDYFAWNRARWDAIRLAERLGATPETLDGGYEYNGYRRLARGMVDRVPGKSWWWVQDDLYVVAFTPVAGYEELRAFPVHRWLPRSPAVVRLLRRR